MHGVEPLRATRERTRRGALRAKRMSSNASRPRAGSEDAKENPSPSSFVFLLPIYLLEDIGREKYAIGVKKEKKISTRNSYPLRSSRVRLNGERRSLGDGGSFRDGNFRADERG